LVASANIVAIAGFSEERQVTIHDNRSQTQCKEKPSKGADGLVRQLEYVV